MKKWMIALVSVVAAVAILISGFFVYRNTHIKNVFDEMYFSEDRAFVKLTSTSFWKADAIRNDKKNSVYINEGVSSFSLEHASLTPNERYGVMVLRDEFTIIFSYSLLSGNGSFHYEISYKVNTKTLGVHGMDLGGYTATNGEYHLRTDEQPVLDDFFAQNSFTEQDVAERAQDILFNVLVPSWLDGNEGHTMFSETDLGTYTINLP